MRQTPLVLFALILALVLGGFLLNKLSLAFPSSFLGGQSFLARILAPEFIAFRVLTRYPAFGLGIGDQTRLFSEAMSFYLSRRADAASTLYQESSARNIITNSFYLHWIYCGLVGGLIMGASIFRSLVSLRVENTFLVVASGVLMSFTLGGYVTVQVWTVILLFSAVLPRRGEIAST